MRTSIRTIAILAAMLPMLAFAGPVNVNTADAATIAAELKGVGLSKARALAASAAAHRADLSAALSSSSERGLPRRVRSPRPRERRRS